MNNPDVTIGVIGNGFVGNAVAQAFQLPTEQTTHTASVRIHDVDKSKSTHSMNDAIGCDYVFICLPTPMTDAEGGECDLSTIDTFFENLPANKKKGLSHGKPNLSVDDDKDDKQYEDDVTIFVIKSTVPIGTTERLSDKYPDMNIIHSPEFITAANAANDFLCADRHVVGGNEYLAEAVSNLYECFFPNTPVITMSSNDSECVKYIANTFLATKVIFFNQMKALCDTVGANWDSVHDGVVTDSRIGESHSHVPGPDGQYGFGGTCFPKDLNSFIDTMEKNGVDSGILNAVWERNKNIREEWDWATNSSAVVQE